MKKALAVCAVWGLMVTAAPLAMAGSGCGGGSSEKSMADESKIVLCGKCGEVAGAEKCCKADVENCAACGLHKGSPGCVAKCAAK